MKTDSNNFSNSPVQIIVVLNKRCKVMFFFEFGNKVFILESEFHLSEQD